MYVSVLSTYRPSLSTGGTDESLPPAVSRDRRESARVAEGMRVVFCFTQKMARTCIGVVSVAENDEITETQ